MIRAALFDVDGTLLDSNEQHVLAWQRAFAELGLAISGKALRKQMGNGGLVDAVCAPEQAWKISERVTRRHVEIFTRDYLGSIRPFPGVVQLFERLRADGIRVALASSAKQWERDRHIAILGVGHLLDSSTSAEAIDHSKPSPDVLQVALQRLGDVAPEEAIAVGDSPFDAVAARKCGIVPIGVLSGSFSDCELLDAGAMHVYRHIAHLLHSYDASPYRSRRRSSAAGAIGLR